MSASVKQYTGDDDIYRQQQSDGWVLFAGVMLATLGTMNLIDGIAAVSKSSFFVGDAKFIFAGLNTWGWVLIVAAVIQLGSAIGVWMRVKGVRWVGVGIAAANLIVQMFFITAYPLWSTMLIALDVLVIYGLVAHGRRL